MSKNESIEFLKKNAKHGDIVVLNNNLIDDSFYFFEISKECFVLISRKKGLDVYYSGEDVTKYLLIGSPISIYAKQHFELLATNEAVLLSEHFKKSEKIKAHFGITEYPNIELTKIAK